MSSVSAVLPRLEQQFESQRLVFWHDAEGEYAAELDAVDLAGVSTLRVENNEYAVKNRVLHGEPTGKFLIYRGSPISPGTGNWLLDLELAYGVFTADWTALVRQGLGLTGTGIDDVVREHEKFFRATKRVQSLKTLLVADDDPNRLRAKMCAVLLGQHEHSMLELTRTLLIENARGVGGKYEALAEQGLDGFHWAGVSRIYGYVSAEPSVDDFVLWMFRHAISGFASDPPSGLRNIQLDFASLRNDRRSANALATLAGRASESLSYASSIEDAELADLRGTDLFEDVERKIISTLARAIVGRTMSARDVTETIRARQSSIWADGYRELYAALGAASDLLSELATARFEIASFDDGLDRYRKHWFRIDQLYRQFHFAARRTENAGPLEVLRVEVEKHYANRYLYELGNSWQQQVDGVHDWRVSHASPADEVLHRSRRADHPEGQPEGCCHHLRRAALRGDRRAARAHPAGRPLRRNT